MKSDDYTEMTKNPILWFNILNVAVLPHEAPTTVDPLEAGKTAY
ncbi:MAG: hypothetical protein ACK4KT_03830 [Thermaurantimonas sp.]